MATLLSMVVRPFAFLIEYGMKDESLMPFGIFPSLHESISIWSKSRFLVSSIPIICMPSAGSP